MRWPIRNQILVPFAVLEIVAVVAISVAAALSAMSRADRDTETRLQRVIKVLRDASFPYHERVLTQMQGLSGAEFVAINSNSGVHAATMNVADDLETLKATQLMQGDSVNLSELLSIQVGGHSYLAARTEGRGPNRNVQLVVLYPEAARNAARRETLLTTRGRRIDTAGNDCRIRMARATHGQPDADDSESGRPDRGRRLSTA